MEFHSDEGDSGAPAPMIRTDVSPQQKTLSAADPAFWNDVIGLQRTMSDERKTLFGCEVERIFYKRGIHDQEVEPDGFSSLRDYIDQGWVQYTPDPSEFCNPAIPLHGPPAHFGGLFYHFDRTLRPSSPPLAPTPALSDTPEPETQTHELGMVEDDRIITKQEGRYFPISLAAEHAQVPRTTLLNWMNAKLNFQGLPLQVYDSPTARKSFLAEESVQRVADRFIKWRSGKPAGPAGHVTLGEKSDQSGYIGLPKAARTIGVDYHTLWLWATQEGKAAPTDKPLDVIQCTASEQFYIRQKDVAQLKRLIPRSGLRRGRRPQLAMS